MSTISPAQINDGDAVTAASVNSPINTIANDYNGNITDANIATAAAIGAQKLAGGVAGMFGAWQSWTPVWTNMVVSSSTVTAKYIQQGKVVHYRLSVVLGGTDKPSGAVSFTLPVTSISYPGTATLPTIGFCQYLISGSAYDSLLVWGSTTTGTFTANGTAGPYANLVNISATIPATFGAASELHAEGWYEAA